MARGRFSITLDSTSRTGNLARGLRPSKKMPRNSGGFLVECAGCVGRDGVLSALDEFERLETTSITDAFPYPQLFLFTRVIIICSSTKIYEWVSSALVEKIEVSAGSTWVALDFNDYIYLSNGNAAVVRDSGDKTYSETTDLPTAMAACNFNGQVILGAPDAGYES